MPSPVIPTIENDDLRTAVRALARAATIVRALFLQARDGRPIDQIVEEHDEAEKLADAVIDTWTGYFGFDKESAFIN